MSDNIIRLPVGKRALSSAEFRDHIDGLSPAERARAAEGLRQLADGISQPRASMHTFLFRSYSVIAEADEAALIRDVGCDLHKAKVKLRKVKERLRSVRAHAAAQVELLTTVEAKLGGAIIAAELSRVKQ